MGSRYQVRTDEVRKFALGNECTTDYFVNNVMQVVVLIFKKRKKIISITRRFY